MLGRMDWLWGGSAVGGVLAAVGNVVTVVTAVGVLKQLGELLQVDVSYLSTMATHQFSSVCSNLYLFQRG